MSPISASLHGRYYIKRPIYNINICSILSLDVHSNKVLKKKNVSTMSFQTDGGYSFVLFDQEETARVVRNREVVSCTSGYCVLIPRKRLIEHAMEMYDLHLCRTKPIYPSLNQILK